jgi:ABC-type glycerol-3-phosphate transport system substrate-binding protein
MYGLPKTGHPGEPFIWVNMTLFDKAGIKRPPTKGATFDDIRTWANAFSKGPKDKRDVYGYYSSIRGAQGWGTAVRMRGTDVVDKDGTTALMDQEGWWQWADWNRQVILEDAVHPLGVQDAGTDLPSMFAAGKLAMFHGARYLHFRVKTQVKDVKDIDWAVIQFPRPPGARGWLTVIDTHSGTQASKYKEESFSLIAAMSDRRFAYLVGKTQGYLTGRVDNLEALKELAEDPFLKLQYECGADQEPNWRAKNLRFYEVEAEVNNQMDEIWLGKKKLDKAHMVGLKQAVDAILAKPEP